MTNGSGVALAPMGRATVCREVSELTFILMQARAHTKGATARKIKEAAKVCGMEVAAAMHGLSVRDVCFVVVNAPRRRARGISASDLRTTRSTVRKVHNIEADFREWCKPATRRKRK